MDLLLSFDIARSGLQRADLEGQTKAEGARTSKEQRG